MAANMETMSRLRTTLPLEDPELHQILDYTATLPAHDAEDHLSGILGDSPEATKFIAFYMTQRHEPAHDHDAAAEANANYQIGGLTSKMASNATSISPQDGDMKKTGDAKPRGLPPMSRLDGGSSSYDGPPKYDQSQSLAQHNVVSRHESDFTRACEARAKDEQHMQQQLQTIQYQYGIYNSEIEPEHETDYYYCRCPIHQYQRMKWNRLGVQEQWAKAVMYPGEKFYTDCSYAYSTMWSNPYKYRVGTPYGYGFQAQSYMYGQRGTFSRANPRSHAQWMMATIGLNNQLNREAQAKVDAAEPCFDIWEEDNMGSGVPPAAPAGEAAARFARGGKEKPDGKGSSKVDNGFGDGVGSSRMQDERKQLVTGKTVKRSKFAGLKNALGVKSSADKAQEMVVYLRRAITQEERERWPNADWVRLVESYQEKVGMRATIERLRRAKPLQYLHLLRAGYFEPIPVAWATQISNPMKFSIEAAAGWRGITPSWRGYEDLAEERLYWVLNHRGGGSTGRLKPDSISALRMANERMGRAVEPPPGYYSEEDTCRKEHTIGGRGGGYSKQVMPGAFRACDGVEGRADDTMILLDVSGSMDFKPMRPVYREYLITDYVASTQPKNRAVAKAIIRRFTDAMENHDHQSSGYTLVTFSNKAHHIGTVNHLNLNSLWSTINFGGGTRVMTGWQKVKDLHFQKHAASATHHPIYGWQAGPQTPILRLLLLLDGEATDMDEFELDLLGLSWAHVTIFLVGVDGCPHHHRHANELQRISDVNGHVAFVDAQGNFAERFVTHELLKRHLGYEMSMEEFREIETPPAYTVVST